MLRVLVTGILTLVLAVPALGADSEPRRGGTYRYPLQYSPKTLDPARSTEIYTVTVVQQLFDGLVDFDQDLNIIPSIAHSWRVSRDGKTYTFDLREGVRFHNGREVTADDVVYSITRLLRPDTQSSAASQFEVIAGAKELREGRATSLRGVRAIDRTHVEITLEEPYSPFLSLLAMKGAKIVPREAIEAKEPPFERAPVGTGPFRFVRWDEGREIVLEANSEYFRGRPYLDKLVYRILPTATDLTVYREFLSAGFEESGIPADLRDEVLANQKIRVIRRPILGIRFYGFNLHRPEWRDRRVREAVLVALDRAGIVNNAFRGQNRPTAGVLPPGLVGYAPGRPVAPADRDRAAGLLKEAGGADRLPPIEIWSAVHTQQAKAELEAISEAWKSLGLTVETRFADDWPQFQRFLTEGRMSVFRYAWYADIPDPDNVLGILFHSKSKYNYMRYANPEVDRLLEQGRAELDPVRRVEIYQQVEARTLADIPIIPLMELSFEQAYQPYVKGVEVSALGAPYVPMRKVWLDQSQRVESRR
jgi:ABC-type transport system substrate-binding protein